MAPNRENEKQKRMEKNERALKAKGSLAGRRQ